MEEGKGPRTCHRRCFLQDLREEAVGNGKGEIVLLNRTLAEWLKLDGRRCRKGGMGNGS